MLIWTVGMSLLMGGGCCFGSFNIWKQGEESETK
jgi:hypothetical protein